jgi:hypothetical protein
MAPRNVGLNSTFNEQRLVINELSVDVDNLSNSGFLTASNLVGYATQGYVNNALNGYATQGYVNSAVTGFITSGALIGYATQGYVNSAVVGYATQGYVNAQIGIRTFSGNYNDLTNKPFIPVNINDLSDVNAGGPSTGQVLKWSGSEWQAASDSTAASGSGIGLTDLSVTINPVGINSLAYNNSTGIFSFTPTDLTGYATTTSIVGFITSGSLSGYATQGYVNNSIVGFITSGASGSNLTGIITSVTAGTGITVTQNIGNVTISATGGQSYWESTAVGIHTLSNVGIGTTNPVDKLTVSGKIQIQQDSGSNNRIVFRGQPESSYRWNIDNYSSSNDLRIFREDDATSANGYVAVSITPTGNLSDGKGDVRAVPANSQTTSYTLTSSDTGKHINITTGGVTVPSGVFSVGDTISIYNNSSSNQTITQGGSVTMYLAGTATTGNRTLAQRGLCTILCVSSNTFVILGGGLT